MVRNKMPLGSIPREEAMKRNAWNRVTWRSHVQLVAAEFDEGMKSLN